MIETGGSCIVEGKCLHEQSNLPVYLGVALTFMTLALGVYLILFEKVEQKEQFHVLTIIPKDENFVLKNSGHKERTTNYFYLFERLPIDWSDNPRQYKYQDFLYTNALFKSTYSFKSIQHIGELIESDKGVICLF